MTFTPPHPLRATPPGLPIGAIVSAKYMLFKPVVGFCHRDRAITVLPIGAELKVLLPFRSGMIEVLREGRSVAVFAQDIVTNGTVGEDLGHARSRSALHRLSHYSVRYSIASGCIWGVPSNPKQRGHPLYLLR